MGGHYSKTMIIHQDATNGEQEACVQRGAEEREWSEDLDPSGKTSQTNLPKRRSIKQGTMRGGCKPGLSPYKRTGKF